MNNRAKVSVVIVKKWWCKTIKVNCSNGEISIATRGFSSLMVSKYLDYLSSDSRHN